MQKIILVDTDSKLTSVRHIADDLNKFCDLKIAERFNSGLDVQGGIFLDFPEVVVAYKNNAIFSCARSTMASESSAFLTVSIRMLLRSTDSRLKHSGRSPPPRTRCAWSG